MHVFSWRADGLDAKVDMRYEDQASCLLYALQWLLCRRQDNLGPVVLVVSIMGALVFSTAHAARNSELAGRLPSSIEKVCQMRNNCCTHCGNGPQAVDSKCFFQTKG